MKGVLSVVVLSLLFAWPTEAKTKKRESSVERLAYRFGSADALASNTDTTNRGRFSDSPYVPDSTVVPMATQTGDFVKSAVEAELQKDGALRRLEVLVAGTEVTLMGLVRTFWEKSEALRRTFEASGVSTVASQIEVPRAEDDQDLTEDVIKAIQRYSYYTMWDQVDFRVNEGAVIVTGRVTPVRDKAGELFERIAKVRGVQDVQMNLEPLPAGRSDERIRNAIARQLFLNPHFERFRTMRNPPFHIIVDNGIVTLLGYAQSQIDKLEMQRIVAQTLGVLRVENQLQTIR